MPVCMCGECGGDVELVAKAGRTRDYGQGRVLPIPKHIRLPECTNCGEEYVSLDTTAPLDALLAPDRWDVELATKDLTEQGFEVAINRVMMDRSLMPKYGFELQDGEREGCIVWSFGAGKFTMPKLFCYGRTIREAHDAFRRAVEGVGPVEAGLRANTFTR